LSQRTEEFVEFVGGLEVGFKLAGGEFFAKIVEAAGKQIERGGEDFLISEDDIAPRGIGAAGEAERVAEARASERDGQAVLIEAVVKERRQSHGCQLGEMRGQSDGVIMLRGAKPERAGADFLKDFDEGRNAGLGDKFRPATTGSEDLAIRA